MADPRGVADVFVSHAVRTHGREVGIIACYGSRVRGDAGPTSDLDLIYVPDEGRAASLSACFVLEGVAYDFFPISWERAERLATGQDGWAVGPSLVAHSRTLYSRSEEDLARFEALKARTAELRRPENRAAMVGRALKAFRDAVFHLGNLRLALRQGDLASTRRAGWCVVMSAVDSLALANQTFFARGWDSNLEEMLALPKRPPDLESVVTAIATSPDAERIAAAAEGLVEGTREVLLREQREVAEPSSVAERFADYYPEILDKVHKLIPRCQSGQRVGASWLATFIQEEVAQFMAAALTGIPYSDFNLYGEYAAHYRDLGLPDLMSAASAEPSRLADQALLFDRGIREWLRGRRVELNELETLEDLRRFLEARDPG